MNNGSIILYYIGASHVVSLSVLSPASYFLNYDSNQVLCFACVTNLIGFNFLESAYSFFSGFYCFLLLPIFCDFSTSF